MYGIVPARVGLGGGMADEGMMFPWEYRLGLGDREEELLYAFAWAGEEGRPESRCVAEVGGGGAARVGSIDEGESKEGDMVGDRKAEGGWGMRGDELAERGGCW